MLRTSPVRGTHQRESSIGWLAVASGTSKTVSWGTRPRRIASSKNHTTDSFARHPPVLSARSAAINMHKRVMSTFAASRRQALSPGVSPRRWRLYHERAMSWKRIRHPLVVEQCYRACLSNTDRPVYIGIIFTLTAMGKRIFCVDYYPTRFCFLHERRAHCATEHGLVPNGVALLQSGQGLRLVFL